MKIINIITKMKIKMFITSFALNKSLLQFCIGGNFPLFSIALQQVKAFSHQN